MKQQQITSHLQTCDLLRQQETMRAWQEKGTLYPSSTSSNFQAEAYHYHFVILLQRSIQELLKIALVLKLPTTFKDTTLFFARKFIFQGYQCNSIFAGINFWLLETTQIVMMAVRNCTFSNIGIFEKSPLKQVQLYDILLTGTLLNFAVFYSIPLICLARNCFPCKTNL